MMTVVRMLFAMILLLLAVVPAGAWSPLDVTSDPLLRMPGSQPGDGIQLTGPNTTSAGQTGFVCTDCHADGENPQNDEGYPVTTGFFWQGSMMSQAARDPIFWAAMTVAGQDSIWGLGNPNAMDLCLRCHFPEGWIEGRSSGPDGSSGLNASLMADSDHDGVHCDVCHRMYDPFFADQDSREGTTDWEEDVAFDFTPLLNLTFFADDTENDNVSFLQSGLFSDATSNLPFYYEAPHSSYETNGGGQFFFAANPDVTIPEPHEESAVDANKRGPFADPEDVGHSFLYSRYHKSKYFCSTCHDVSNPALANLGLDPNLVDQSGGTHQISEQYDAGKYFHVERTFSEFILSAYAADGGAATNSEFQSLGASNVTHAGTCQDCHMRDVVGVGAPGGTTRPRSTGPHPDTGSPLHNLQGGNLWITQILASIDPDGPVYDATNEAILTSPAAAITLDLSPSNLPKGFSNALLDGSFRAEQQLILAAAIKNVVYDPETGALSFRILNNTGHKLISGFPEGRRMWINIKAFDDITSLYEVNPYDEAAGTLQGLNASYTTDTSELPLPGNLNPLTQSYADELVYEMHPSSSLTGEEETFHFVLADGRYKDNRIPPKGFDIANAPNRESEPVWHGVSASDYFFAPEYAGGYDQVNLQIAPGATSVTVTLYYQGTSREYLEFLRDEINGKATTLKEPTFAQDMGWNTDSDPAYLIQSDPFFTNMKDWGDTIWNLWKHNHGLDGSAADVPGITPYAMASVAALTSLGGDNDLDGLTDKYEINTGTDPFNTDTDGDGTHDAADSFPLDASLSVATPQATVSPSSVDFGSVNQASNAVVTLKNTGNADLTINTVTSPSAPFSIDAEDCTTLSPLFPNASCTVTVTYTPAGSSTYLDTLLIDTAVSIGDDVQVALSGTSSTSAVPDISLSDSVDPADDNNLPFGSWAANMLVEASVTVTNSGNADLTLGTVAAIDRLVTPFTISADTCSDANIAPAANCSITVEYQSAIVGIFNDSFDIPVTNDPDTSSVTITLSAVALPIGSNNAPEAPVLLTPAPAETTASTDVTFTWELSTDPENDPVTYEVIYSTDQGFASSDSVIPVAAVVAGGGLMFALIGLPLFSQRRHRTMLLLMLLAISTWLMVACDGSSGGTSAATNTTPVTPVTGTEQATATGLTAATTYYWKVVASDDHGNATESEVRSFTTP
jgi:cytochrome c553